MVYLLSEGIMTKATTVYIEEELLQAVKIKAVQVHTSVSRLVGDALRQSLKEDAADLEVIHKRQHEPLVSFEQVLKNLKKNGLL